MHFSTEVQLTFITWVTVTWAVSGKKCFKIFFVVIPKWSLFLVWQTISTCVGGAPPANPSLRMTRKKILRHIFPWHSSHGTPINQEQCYVYQSVKGHFHLSYLKEVSFKDWFCKPWTHIVTHSFRPKTALSILFWTVYELQCSSHKPRRTDATKLPCFVVDKDGEELICRTWHNGSKDFF